MRAGNALEMSELVRLIPGLAGAAAAFLTAKVIRMLPFGSLALETLAFLVTYVVVALMVDQAMRRYGRGRD